MCARHRVTLLTGSAQERLAATRPRPRAPTLAEPHVDSRAPQGEAPVKPLSCPGSSENSP